MSYCNDPACTNYGRSMNDGICSGKRTSPKVTAKREIREALAGKLKHVKEYKRSLPAGVDSDLMLYYDTKIKVLEHLIPQIRSVK